MTYAQLNVVENSPDFPDMPYIPRDDEAEAEQWARLNASLGLGEEVFDDNSVAGFGPAADGFRSSSYQ